MEIPELIRQEKTDAIESDPDRNRQQYQREIGVRRDEKKQRRNQQGKQRPVDLLQRSGKISGNPGAEYREQCAAEKKSALQKWIGWFEAGQLMVDQIKWKSLSQKPVDGESRRSSDQKSERQFQMPPVSGGKSQQ